MEEDKLGKKEAVAKCVLCWNRMVNGLLGAKKSWDAYKEARLSSGLGLEDFVEKDQKILYLANPHGEFDFLIEDIVTHRDLESYLQGLVIK